MLSIDDLSKQKYKLYISDEAEQELRHKKEDNYCNGQSIEKAALFFRYINAAFYYIANGAFDSDNHISEGNYYYDVQPYEDVIATILFSANIDSENQIFLVISRIIWKHQGSTQWGHIREMFGNKNGRRVVITEAQLIRLIKEAIKNEKLVD